MPKWRGLIFNRGFVYFVVSIIIPFVGCLYLLKEIHNFEFAEASTIESQFSDHYAPMLSMVFVGDAMFDRMVRLTTQRQGSFYPFIKIASFIQQYDIGVLNLEGVYTDSPSVSTYDNNTLRFTFDPQGAADLKKAGFDFVSQANNHTNDFGRDGAATSKSVLEAADVEAVGDFFNQSNVVVFERKGQKIALFGFNEFSYTGLQEIKTKITEAHKDGLFTIVFAHFGTEYEREPVATQKEMAHGFVDSGADLVVGAHPHVIEPLEVYKGKLIAYSLGNFIFDQSFSKETQTSIALSVFLDQKTVGIQVTPLEVEHAQPTLLMGQSAKEILEKIAADSEVPKSFKQKIRRGGVVYFAR